MEIFLNLGDLKPEVVEGIKKLTLHILKEEIDKRMNLGTPREVAEQELIGEFLEHGKVRVRVEI